MESFYRSYFLMPQAGYVPDSAATFQHPTRKRSKQSPSFTSVISKFFGLASPSQGPVRTSQRISVPPADSYQEYRLLTDTPGSTITDTSLSSFSDESSTGSPASIFSDCSNASSATSLDNEFPNTPPSPTCSVTAHDLCSSISSTTLLGPESCRDFPLIKPATRLLWGVDTCSVTSEEYSSAYAVDDPLRETRADSDGWLQPSTPVACDYASIRGEDPSASHADDGLFVEGNVTSDDWHQVRCSWIVIASRAPENCSLSSKGTTLSTLSGISTLNTRHVPAEGAPSSVVASVDIQAPSTIVSSGFTTMDTAYRPASGVVDPSDGQVWMFYDSDSDVDDDDEHDVHKAFMEHIEERRRRKQSRTKATFPAASAGLGSTRVSAAHPTKQRKTSYRRGDGRNLVTRFHARSV